MANRPVFLPLKSKTSYVRELSIEFQWFAGMSVSQKQKSIVSLHEATRKRLGDTNILEISSKSKEPLGVQLSAFNLKVPLDNRLVAVEVAFQAGKVFEKGGPFLDLLDGTSRDAKGDVRLQASGRLIGFTLSGESWPLTPRTAFYDWIYLRALVANPDLAEQLLEYQAFTDIEFNPEKSLNCQARTAALYVSLHQEGILEKALSDKAAYLGILGSPVA
jgi:hypothetical protein